jgi:hypothetical protein
MLGSRYKDSARRRRVLFRIHPKPLFRRHRLIIVFIAKRGHFLQGGFKIPSGSMKLRISSAIPEPTSAVNSSLVFPVPIFSILSTLRRMETDLSRQPARARSD